MYPPYLQLADLESYIEQEYGEKGNKGESASKEAAKGSGIGGSQNNQDIFNSTSEPEYAQDFSQFKADMHTMFKERVLDPKEEILQRKIAEI